MTRGLQETSKWTALGVLTTGTMITAQSGRIMIPKVGVFRSDSLFPAPPHADLHTTVLIESRQAAR